MASKTIFAGFGGQGVLSMGLNLAQAGMLEDKSVTYLPAYGAEMRGGTANCTVAISDEEIASPVASSPEFLVAMNWPSLVRFQNQVRSGGVFFINSSLMEANIPREDVDMIEVPANDMAEELGNLKCANMVMLGAFIKKSQVVSLETLVKGLEESFKKKPKLIPLNTQALTNGYELF
jgi:2-oxoglutarate ferredoxin oxidoreductase subunit gamma